jgi:hypothetical protein
MTSKSSVSVILFLDKAVRTIIEWAARFELWLVIVSRGLFISRRFASTGLVARGERLSRGVGRLSWTLRH